MRIPVYSSTIRRSEMDAVLTCLVEEKIGPGEMNQKLIRLVREMYAAEGAIALRSPASALIYALKSFDLPEKAGVLLSALAPAWQYTEILRNGFTPILLDADPLTALVTVQAVEEGIQKGGRILVLHETLGNMPDMDAFAALPIPIIEDVSQSAGAFYGEKRAGSFGAFTILGLEERDILTAGGGALLITADRRNAAVLKNIADMIPITDYLPDINASLAAVQLKNMEKNMHLREEMRELYVRALLQTRHKSLSFSEQLKNPVYSFPVILESGFKEVKQYANRKDVEIELAFTGSIADFLKEDNTCIHAGSLLLRTVLFPLYPRLGIKNASKISKILGTLP
ncbi:MAG: DegT/DnrJ/EryC1/StrS family aminotransferase [Treponema sp.]